MTLFLLHSRFSESVQSMIRQLKSLWKVCPFNYEGPISALHIMQMSVTIAVGTPCNNPARRIGWRLSDTVESPYKKGSKCEFNDFVSSSVQARV